MANHSPAGRVCVAAPRSGGRESAKLQCVASAHRPASPVMRGDRLSPTKRCCVIKITGCLIGSLKVVQRYATWWGRIRRVFLHWAASFMAGYGFTFKRELFLSLCPPPRDLFAPAQSRPHLSHDTSPWHLHRLRPPRQARQHRPCARSTSTPSLTTRASSCRERANPQAPSRLRRRTSQETLMLL